jgi:hypothetical protein
MMSLGFRLYRPGIIVLGYTSHQSTGHNNQGRQASGHWHLIPRVRAGKVPLQAQKAQTVFLISSRISGVLISLPLRVCLRKI